jgi:hypothetical protein
MTALQRNYFLKKIGNILQMIPVWLSSYSTQIKLRRDRLSRICTRKEVNETRNTQIKVIGDRLSAYEDTLQSARQYFKDLEYLNPNPILHKSHSFDPPTREEFVLELGSLDSSLASFDDVDLAFRLCEEKHKKFRDTLHNRGVKPTTTTKATENIQKDPRKLYTRPHRVCSPSPRYSPISSPTHSPHNHNSTNKSHFPSKFKYSFKTNTSRDSVDTLPLK